MSHVSSARARDGTDVHKGRKLRIEGLGVRFGDPGSRVRESGLTVMFAFHR